MIITNIIGGLGNQMFQYAVGRALSLMRKQPLKLDTSGFSTYDLHQGFELQRIFNSSAEIVSTDELREVLGWQHHLTVRQLFSRSPLSVFRHKALIVEPHFHYWNGIKNVPNKCYLMGYWQTEQYFHEISTQIRKDFTFKLPLSDENSKLAKTIKQLNAISLHIRRGDYANNPKTTAIHGLCDLKYYQSAIKYITDQVSQPHFVIFSDDIIWVKKNLTIEFPHQYVCHNTGIESYNDMRLMSLCKHHIIANSSFSWWGAWLNNNPEKIIVAPKNWFVRQEMQSKTNDIYPNTWIKL